MRIFIILFFTLILAGEALALSSRQVERLKAAMVLLGEADQRSLKETIEELNNSSFPEGQLTIMEAVAATYTDIVDEYALTDPEAKERLLGKIRLNMAYFQLAGEGSDNPNDSSLNILIRRTLRKYLPQELMDDPSLFYSLE